MKTETVLGEEVLRVEETGGGGCQSRAGELEMNCVFLNRNCALSNGVTACGFTRTMFIRPDQLNDYLAIKLVS